jgi:hypothetical protein
MAADVAAMGTHILVVTDDDKPKADALAEELGMEIFSHRGNLRPPYYTIDSVRKTAHLFLSFPYVCPEPVLAKCSFLYTNGSQMPFFAGVRCRAEDTGKGPKRYVTTYTVYIFKFH